MNKLKDIDRESIEIFVIADSVRSLYNVGSLFRLCDGVGVTKLYLCGLTGAPYDRLKYQRQRQQIAKTALEGLDSVDWEYRENVIDLINELKQREVQVVALEQAKSSFSYLEAKYNRSICLVIGHEADGVSKEVLESVDFSIEIPMYGAGKSLNVISASSIALYAIRMKLESK